MSKNSNSKSVTMLGGKNVAHPAGPRQKPPKVDTGEPEEQTPAADSPPEKPTE